MPTYSIYKIDPNAPGRIVLVRTWTYSAPAWKNSTRVVSAEYHAQFPNDWREKGPLHIAQHISHRAETPQNFKNEGLRVPMDPPALPDSYRSEDLEPVETRLEKIARLLSELHTEIHSMEKDRG